MIPTVVTSTVTFPDHTTTVAYLVGTYPAPYGATSTYVISEYDDLAEASAEASSLAIAVSVLGAAGYPAGAVTSQFGAYQAVPSSTGAAHSPSYTSVAAEAAHTASPTPSQDNNNNNDKKHHGPPPSVMAVSVIVPLLVIIVVIVLSLLCIRHYRRKARKAQAVEMAARNDVPEMKSVAVGGSGSALMGGAREERAYISPATRTAPPTLAMASTSTSTGAEAEPPIILSTTMDNGFYSGIDTSDNISLNDNADVRSQASRDTFGEEPPPPYRPRSVPPMSRETSLRTILPGRNSSVRSSRCDSITRGGGGSFIRRSNEVRSPFDDPEEEDEDTMSEVSTIRGSMIRREVDELSTVSDMSYQEEPTLSHSTV